MDELRNKVREMLLEHSVAASALPMSVGLVLAHPIFGLLMQVVRVPYIAELSGVLYILYLFGMLACFAEEKNGALGAAFAVNTLSELIKLVQYPGLSHLTLMGFYGFLAFWCLRDLIPEGQEEAAYAFQQAAGGAGEILFCPACGSPADPSGRFCPFCGEAYPARGGQAHSAPGFQSTVGVRSAWDNGFSGAFGTSGAVCGGMLALVFSILLTCQIVFSMVAAEFGFVSIVLNLLPAAFCVGCWMAFLSSRRGRSADTGLKVIGVSAIVGATLCGILLLCGVFFSLWCISQKMVEVGNGMLMMLGLALIPVLTLWNWIQLRLTTERVRTGIPNSGNSLYSIVFLGILAFFQFLLLVLASKVGSFVGDLQNSWLFGGSTMGYGDMSGLSSLLGGAMDSASHSAGMGILNSLLSVAVTICAMVILVKLRKQSRSA